jgi:hypothetical protein
MFHARSCLGLALLVLGLGLLGCGGGDDADDDKPQNSPSADADDLRGYFPMQPGMRWVYDIECPTNATQVQWDFVWPTAGDQLVTQTHSSTSSGGDKGELAFRIKETGVPPTEAGLEKYDSGAIVEIESDTMLRYVYIETGGELLPQFVAPKQVFWAVREKPFEIHEVLLFDVIKAPAEAVLGSKPHQARVLLFAPPFGDVQILSSKVWLVRLDADSSVPGYEGEPCLHFVRKFGDKEAPSFTEDLWFAKGKGLVRLEQKAGGNTTLRQTLREFTDGSP